MKAPSLKTWAKAGALLLVLNEIRGLVTVGLVLAGWWKTANGG